MVSTALPNNLVTRFPLQSRMRSLSFVQSFGIYHRKCHRQWHAFVIGCCLLSSLFLWGKIWNHSSPFIVSFVTSVTPVRMQESPNVSGVNEIVNVKANQASPFQLIVFGLINWIHSAKGNIMQLYFAYSWLKSLYWNNFFSCLSLCVCVWHSTALLILTY